MILIRRLFGTYILPHWKKLLLAFFLTALGNQAPYAFSWLGKWLVDEVLQIGQASNPMNSLDNQINSLWIFLGISIGLRAATASLGGLSGYLTQSTSQRVLYHIRSDLQAKLTNLPLSFYDRFSTGQLMVRVTADANVVQQNSVNLPVNIGMQLVTLGVGINLLWQINSTMTLIALASLPFYSAGSAIFMGAIRKNAGEVRNANSELQSRLEEKLTNVATIQYYGQEPYESTRFIGRLTENLTLLLRQNKLKTGLSAILMAISGLGATSVLFYGYLQLESGSMKLGEVMACYQIAALLFGPITALTNSGVLIQTMRVVLGRVYEILDAHPDVIESPDAVDIEIVGDIQFDKVSLRYLENGPIALNQVSFRIKEGHTMALLGPSGCGKSSVVNVLQRFYDVSEGSVLIDKNKLQNIRLECLRDAIGLAGQDAKIFSGTVSENIAFGNPGISTDMVEHCANLVGIHGTLVNLPKGYDTPLGKGGHTLEQGIVQKLAVARTLVGNPKILVFDDSASAITEEGEVDLYQSISKAFVGRTILIVTNRVGTAELADTIAVMRNGLIVEIGTPEELKNLRGVYWRMHLHQTEQPEKYQAEVILSTPDQMEIELTGISSDSDYNFSKSLSTFKAIDSNNDGTLQLSELLEADPTEFEEFFKEIQERRLQIRSTK